MSLSEPVSRIAIAERLIATRIASHDGLLGTWKGLEAKAQGVAGLSGAFIGAVFAFIRASGDATPLFDRRLLAIALGFLSSAVLCSVFALLIRSVPGRPLDAAAKGLTDLLKIEDHAPLSSRLQALLEAESTAWEELNTALHKGNTVKARLVKTAQAFVAAAILVVASLSWRLLFPG